MIETWKLLDGLGEKYEVSNLGRVRTLPIMQRYTHGRTGQELFRLTKIRILAQQKQNSGYKLVHLWHNDKRVACTVHRLVAIYFMPNIEGLREVNHIDGDKTNNRLDNLEWVSSSENKKHAVETSLNRQAFKVRDPKTGIVYVSQIQAMKETRKGRKTIKNSFERIENGSRIHRSIDISHR